MIEVALSQSSSLYSREPRMWCRAKGWCGFGRVWWGDNPSVCVGKENLIRAFAVLTICGLNVMIKVI